MSARNCDQDQLKQYCYALFFPKQHWNSVTKNYCVVGCGCRIYRLHLCRGVTPPHNESPGYDIKLSDSEPPAFRALGNAEYFFIVITPWSTLTQGGRT